jgi:hypothetical protein
MPIRRASTFHPANAYRSVKSRLRQMVPAIQTRQSFVTCSAYRPLDFQQAHNLVRHLRPVYLTCRCFAIEPERSRVSSSRSTLASTCVRTCRGRLREHPRVLPPNSLPSRREGRAPPPHGGRHARPARPLRVRGEGCVVTRNRRRPALPVLLRIPQPRLPVAKVIDASTTDLVSWEAVACRRAPID